MLRAGHKNRYCKKSKIYNSDHIKSVGINCPYKHSEYYWPAKVKNNHCIIGDSIVKFLKITNQADVIAFPGATIDRLYWKIKLEKVLLRQYKVIVLHVGTNDLQGNGIEEIVLKYLRLLELVKDLNNSVRVGVSSVLPKPCETPEENNRIILLNRELKKLCGSKKVHFIPSYRPFVGKKQYINEEFYAKDKLHLNHRGSVRLRNNLVGNIKSIQGLTNSK